jgi:hypothetical protein
LAEDITAVTGVGPEVLHALPQAAEHVVLVGTLGKSPWLDALVGRGALDVADIRGQWESFVLATVAEPFPNVRQALVIAGSDRRATAYGVFALSEAMGVSPWSFWADVRPQPKPQLFVAPGRWRQGPPSVQYRGIFINDEGFGGLHPWAKQTFDPALGDIGPKTYTKVFELLLRLRANTLWPAMHAMTQPFNAYPQNRQLADDYAIVMGSSHCEPMLENVTFWKPEDFNYLTRRTQILAAWEERLRTNGRFENIYTLGIRGVSDTAMQGASSVDEAVRHVGRVIEDQRQLLQKYVNPDLRSVPQALMAYKEVQATLEAGLRVPDDVTLLWADDNHGYTRHLSSPAEQRRSGGAGIYYHLSVLGTPEAFLWLSTISPSLMAYELHKTYAFGGRRMWIFNVGDIKPAEKELSFALAMAWNIDRWTPANADGFMREWLGRVFGEANADELGALMREYYRLAAAGKPEMVYRVEYSPAELDLRLARYRRMADVALGLRYRIPARLQDAYFELVLYPVLGCRWMNERVLLARRSLWRAAAREPGALEDAALAQAAERELDQLTARYNRQTANGKWDHMMNWYPWPPTDLFPRTLAVATAADLERAKQAPPPISIDLRRATFQPPMALVGNAVRNTGDPPSADARVFAASFRFQSPRAGRTALWVKAVAPSPAYDAWPSKVGTAQWLQVNDTVVRADYVTIGNAWHTTTLAPVWYRLGDFELRQGENRLELGLADPLLAIEQIAFGLVAPRPAEAFVVVPASKPVRQRGAPGAQWSRVPGLGGEEALAVLPFGAAPFADSQVASAPRLEYEVELPAGTYALEVRALPTQRPHAGRGVRLGVAINAAPPLLFDLHADEFTPEWQDNVVRGYAARRVTIEAKERQRVIVRLSSLDPGVALLALVFYAQGAG